MDFITDLVRRRVFRTAAVYAVIAWGLTEALTTVAEKLLFPDWVGAIIVIAFLVGFPVAMYLAWVFDITAEGIRRTQPTSMKGWMAMTLSAVLLVSGTATLFWLIYPGERVPEIMSVALEDVDLPDDTIAVLPFWNATGDEGSAYYADGIAETLLGQLSRVSALRVIARDSSFALRNPSMDLRRKARRLNAGYLLDGSVQRAGDAIRIIARLVDGETGQYLWAEVFDGTTAEVFDIQDQISAAVVSHLSGADSNTAALQRHTANAAAFDHYLRGLYQFNIRTPESLELAIEQFSQAIELDTEFALAYVGRANAHAIDSMWGIMGSYEGTAPIRTDATDYAVPRLVRQEAANLAARIEDDVHKALRLGPALAETHAAAGLLLLIEQDYDAAEAALLRAIELSPSYAFGHHMYGLFLREVNRFGESTESLETALELDSLSYTLALDLALAYGYSGDLESAYSAFESLIQDSPERFAAYRELFANLFMEGRRIRATEVLLSYVDRPEFAELFWGEDRLVELIGGLAMSGDDAAVELMFSQISAWSDDHLMKLPYLAVASWFRPDRTTALADMRAMFDGRDLADLSAGTLVIVAMLEVHEGESELALTRLEEVASRHDPLNWPYGIMHLENNRPFLDALTLAAAHRGLGEDDEARRLAEGALSWADQMDADGFGMPVMVAVRAKAHALLGEEDRALELLADYADSPAALGTIITADGTLSTLIDDPRFQAIIERIDDARQAEFDEAWRMIDAYEARQTSVEAATN